MKRWLLCAPLSVLLSACPSKPADAPPDPTLAPSPPAVPVTSTRTLAPAPEVVPAAGIVAATSTAATATAAGAVAPSPPDAPPRACARWAGQPRCALGEHAFASADARGIRDANLARVTAVNRARAALAGGTGAVSGAEVVKVETCGPSTWALVRAPASAVPAAGLAACDAEAFAGL